MLCKLILLHRNCTFKIHLSKGNFISPDCRGPPLWIHHILQLQTSTMLRYATYFTDSWMDILFSLSGKWKIHQREREAMYKNHWTQRSALNAERIRVYDFGSFDQAQVEHRESLHYGLWQIRTESNGKLLCKANQNTCQCKHTLGFRLNSQDKILHF